MKVIRGIKSKGYLIILNIIFNDMCVCAFLYIHVMYLCVRMHVVREKIVPEILELRLFMSSCALTNMSAEIWTWVSIRATDTLYPGLISLGPSLTILRHVVVSSFLFPFSMTFFIIFVKPKEYNQPFLSTRRAVTLGNHLQDLVTCSQSKPQKQCLPQPENLWSAKRVSLVTSVEAVQDFRVCRHPEKN